MQEQNLKNHPRIVPVYHFLTYGLCLAILIASLWKLYRSYHTGFGGIFVPGILCLTGLALILITFFTRSFALKAQDRAIRAEENLRYFAITGNLLDSKLTIQQIIALRFAPNNELLDLAHRAVSENLAPADIKKAIKNWKGDYDRV